MDDYRYIQFSLLYLLTFAHFFTSLQPAIISLILSVVKVFNAYISGFAPPLECDGRAVSTRQESPLRHHVVCSQRARLQKAFY